MHIHICTYVHPQSSETLRHKALGSIWVRQSPVCSKGPEEKKICEKGWDSICCRGCPKRHLGLRILLGEERTWQHWPHKVIFQEAKSTSEVWQRIWTTAANHKAAEEILKSEDFRWWLIQNNSFTTPTCSASPMVSAHPSCPAIRCWPRERWGHKTELLSQQVPKHLLG